MATTEAEARAERLRDEEDDGQPQVHWAKVTRFVLGMVGRHPWLLTAFLLAALGVAAAEVVSIALIAALVGSFASEGAFALPENFALGFLAPLFDGMSTVERVRGVAFALVGVQLVRGGLAYTESRIAGYLEILLERDLRQRVFDDLLDVELRYIHKEKTATLFTLLHNFPRQSADVAKEYLGAVSKSIAFTMIFLAVLATSWQLTLVAAALGLFSMLVVGRIRNVIKRIARRINASRVRLHQVSLESLGAMKVIRLYAREAHARKRFLREVEELQRRSYRKASVSAAAAPLQRLMSMVLVAVLIVAGTLILDQTEDGWLLTLVIFLGLMGRLMGPLSQATQKRAKIAGDMPALEAVIAFLHADKPRLRDGAREFGRLREGVRFEGVTFGYDAAAPPIVGPVSFEVPRGRMVALVGESGSGKSTLVNLLARLSDPVSGRIVVDGADLREYRAGSWRQRVAVVSQDTFLFNETVRENIRFGRLDASDAEVERAARLANAHDFILEMEHGYDTIVGDRGVRLSGGQAQRLAIARAILADPDVLVLDEATSALDTATERAVQQALDAVSRDRTVVAVAHRLSTIRHADQILVLEKGRIVERGTHDELMALGGRYAHYVSLQDVTTAQAPREPHAGIAPSGRSSPRSGEAAKDGEDRPTATEDDGVSTASPVFAALPLRAEDRTQGAQPQRAQTASHALRVLLKPGRHATCTVANGTLRRDVPVLALRAGEDAEARLRAADGDAVVLAAGADAATVRVAGELHRAVPLFQAHDAGEVRVRVRSLG